MNIDQALITLGLQDKEPEVYLTLLKLPGAQAASVIAARAGLNRTTTYKTLMRLVKKGLATKTQYQGITCFFAEEPDSRLKILVNNKKKQLEFTGKTLLDALPLLTVSDKGAGQLPYIRQYEGVEGIKHIYEIMLKEEQDMYRYGDSIKLFEVIGDYLIDFMDRKKRLGLKTYAINPLYEGEPTNKEIDESDSRDILFIPYKLFPIHGEIRICGNKVSIISLRKDCPIGVLIRSETIAGMFKSIFMLTWKNYGNRGMRFD